MAIANIQAEISHLKELKESKHDDYIPKLKDAILRADRNQVNQLCQLMTQREIRQIVLEIFKKNEGYIANESDADEGLMGTLNKKSWENRRDNYYKKVLKAEEKGERITRVLAEGDSWFEFPQVIKDILDWLDEEPGYAVYSMAYAGDWLSNILYEGKYVEELPLIRPHAFMLSGGGNDIVGIERLPGLLRHAVEDGPRGDDEPIPPGLLPTKLPDDPALKAKVELGRRYYSDEFPYVLATTFIMYVLMINSVRKKYPDLKIITQGYDYAIPRKGAHWEDVLRRFYQPIINKLVKSGGWLWQPLVLRGIVEPEKQRSVLIALIWDFNETLIQLGDLFDHVYHVDSRGLATEDDWFDEMHLTSKTYKRVAKVYKTIIDLDHPPKKVWVVKDEA